MVRDSNPEQLSCGILEWVFMKWTALLTSFGVQAQIVCFSCREACWTAEKCPHISMEPWPESAVSSFLAVRKLPQSAMWTCLSTFSCLQLWV